MNTETIITFNITAGVLLAGMSAFFLSLLAIIWKGKKEIGDAVKDEMKPFQSTATMLIHNVKVISDHLAKNSKKFDLSELKATSPYQLTEQGEKFIKDLGFNSVLENESNKKAFFDFIDSEKSVTKYDVEVSAIKSIYAFSDEPYMKFLKVFLYNNPKRDMGNIAPTLGIYVRNKYLEAHPEIKE